MMMMRQLVLHVLLMLLMLLLFGNTLLYLFALVYDLELLLQLLGLQRELIHDYLLVEGIVCLMVTSHQRLKPVPLSILILLSSRLLLLSLVLILVLSLNLPVV